MNLDASPHAFEAVVGVGGGVGGGCISSRLQKRLWKHRGLPEADAVLKVSPLPVFSHSRSERLPAEQPLSEAWELIFEGVPVTPSPTGPGPAKAAEGGKNILADSQKEAGEKAPGQAGQAKVQGDTSRGIEFQAVPSEKSEVGQALCLTAREEDCFQILGRPGAGGDWGGQGAPQVSPRLPV